MGLKFSIFFSPGSAPGHLGQKNDQFSTSCSTESDGRNWDWNFPFFSPGSAPGHLGQKNVQFNTSCSTESDGRNWGWNFQFFCHPNLPLVTWDEKMTNLVQVVVRNLMVEIGVEIFHFLHTEPTPGHLGRK